MLTDRQAEIAAENYPLVVSYLNQKGYTGQLFDDLHGDACLGLMDAVRQYEPEKGSFSTLAWLCIRRRLSAVFRKQRAQKRGEEFPAGDEHDIKKAYPDQMRAIYAAHMEEYADIEFMDMWEKIDLDQEERELLRWREEGISQKEIAMQLNVTQPSVSRRLNKLAQKVIQAGEPQKEKATV